jgi:hypothetical protein
MRLAGSFVVATLLCSAPMRGQANPACQIIHGRAHLYTADGQLRVWQLGTHHEFQPDRASWQRVESWLEQGAAQARKGQNNAPTTGDTFLYGHFKVCPVEPYREGAVQTASIPSVRHRRYAFAR